MIVWQRNKAYNRSSETITDGYENVAIDKHNFHKIPKFYIYDWSSMLALCTCIMDYTTYFK